MTGVVHRDIRPLRWRDRMVRCLVFVGLLLAGVALLLVPAGPASAHAVLTSGSPSANAVLPSAPTEVVLTFSEPVRKVGDKVRVIGPDGDRVDRGTPRFDGKVVTIRVDPGPQGTYLVSYRVISADSHPVSGGYTYSVGAPSTPPTDTADQAGDPAVAVAIKVVKYVGYAGLVLLVGPVLVLSLLWPRRLSRRGPARLFQTGVGLLTGATLAALWLQGPYTNGGGLLDVSGGAMRDVLGSPFGAVHLVRLAILLSVVVLTRPLFASVPQGRADRLLLVLLGGAGLFTWPMTGHAGASQVAAVSVVADVVHLASMAVWLGGLVMLVAFLLRQADDRELAAILPVWSRWAAAAVGLLLLAGAVQAVIEVATLDALTSTTYGRLVLAKVALLALVVAVAAYSRQLVRRADRSFRLRRAVLVEVAVTAVILAVSATLVQTTPARTAVEGHAGTSNYFSTRLTSSLYVMQVEVDPATSGNNSIHLYAYTPDNKPLRVLEWKASVALPGKGIEAVAVPLLPFTDNHAAGEVDLPTPGDWLLRVTARTSDVDQVTVTATVPIRP